MMPQEGERSTVPRTEEASYSFAASSPAAAEDWACPLGGMVVSSGSGAPVARAGREPPAYELRGDWPTIPQPMVETSRASSETPARNLREHIVSNSMRGLFHPCFFSW